VSLIRRTVMVLAPFAANRIIVVAPPRGQRIGMELRGLRVNVVLNPNRSLGLSASVNRGLKTSRFSGATLLVPLDLAELNTRDIARLISRWQRGRRRLTARRLADRASTPLILPRWLYSRARQIAGDVGLRVLLAESTRGSQVLVDLPSAERDVDTPRDLDDARKRSRYRTASIRPAT
jgi:molybdenum cofactor cytidylyltransferase